MKESNQTNSASNLAVVQQPTTSINFFDPKQFEIAQRFGAMFSASGLVPDMYREGKNTTREQAIANCVIALDVATRIGASPLAVMQNLVVIYNKPTWSSTFLISTINACGRFRSLKFKMTNKGMVGKIDYDERLGGRLERKTFDGTKVVNWECIAYTTEKGSDEVLESVPVSVEMAIKEGWYTKPGSKWQSLPQLMLQYRSAAFWARVFAPELSMGIRTQDEAQDIEDAVFEDVTTQVEHEKREDANKTEIDIDTAQEQQQSEEDKKNAKSKTVKTDDGKIVNTETGEVVEEQQQQPSGDGNLPGF